MRFIANQEPNMSQVKSRLTSRLTTLPTLLAGSLVLMTALAQAQVCVNVEVHNVRPQQGHLMLAAYGDAESFGKKPVQAVRVAAGEAVMNVQVCGLPGNSVAFMLFQDLDSDGKMARNALGMPSEPWGGSGTPGMMGPTWETGQVALDGKPIVVRLSM
jgi:uncharacterized protein (DUF2141 family)